MKLYALSFEQQSFEGYKNIKVSVVSIAFMFPWASIMETALWSLYYITSHFREK